MMPGWSLGWVSALDLEGRTIWIVDAHGCGRRFIVRADEIPTAFLELASAIRLRRTLSEGVVADSPAWAGDALYKN